MADLESSRGLPTGTLHALAMQESGGNPNAVSSAGARGLTQFMPATAKEYNVDVTDPLDSLRGTADYLYDLRNKYNGSLPAALAHYNGGGGQAQAVLKTGTPTYAETKNYVSSIMGKIPGALLNAVIPSANAAEVVPGQQAAALQAAQQAQQQDDAQSSPTSSMSASDGMLQIQSNIIKAKAQGYSDQAIAAGLENNPLIRDQVARMGDEGVDPSDVVKHFGGDVYAKYLDDVEKAKPTNGMSATQLLLAGAGKSFADLGHGTAQLWHRITGNDEALAQDQADQAERERLDAPLMDTGLGKIGYGVGTVAPFIAGGGALDALGIAGKAAQAANALGTVGKIATSAPVRLAAQGAMQGALTPTTGDGQFGRNVLTGATVGGALGGAGSAVGALGSQVGKLGDYIRGGTSADVASKIGRLEQAGIPVSAADISPMYGGVADRIGKLPLVGLADGRKAQGQALAQALASRVGENASTIDSDLIKSAQNNIGQRFDNALQGVQVQPSSAFTTDLNNSLSQYNASNLPSLRDPMVNTVISDLKNLAAAGNVDAQQLQNIRASIGRKIASPAVDGNTKQVLGSVMDSIDNELTNASANGMTPAQAAQYMQARDQWRHLQTLENLVRSTNDTGTFTPRQLASAIKTGNRAAFERGNAPYQDLVTDFLSLKGKPLSQVENQAIGTGEALMALNNPTGLAKGAAIGIPLQKLITSTNPAVRNALLGMSNVPGFVATSINATAPASTQLANALAAYAARRGNTGN